MSVYDFDRVIPRKDTNSLKYDFAEARGVSPDLLPMWVADMDFAAPPEVVEALVAKARHGIFGYSEPDDAYYATLAEWFAKRHGWHIDPAAVIQMPGVVFALATMIRVLTQAGDAVLIQEPVYYPFRYLIVNNDRQLVTTDLVLRNGKYEVDWADFEQKIVDCKVKLFLLCSPHNPVGRVWMHAELLKMGEICLRHNVFVLADEIHQDFIYPGHRHTVFANINEAFQHNSVICTAPSKTFNLAGLHIANTIIPDPQIHRAVIKELYRVGYSQPNIMGLVACQAAYQFGAPWLDELNVYLAGNLDYFRTFLKERLPELALIEPEGTYLTWVDFSRLGLPGEELERLIQDRARLWLDAGSIFGHSGTGFERFNIACPRSVLTQALTQLEAALRSK